MKVSSVAEMQEMDRTAIKKFGITEEILMENAGHAVFSVIQHEIGVTGRSFAIFCGTGNNGGDGLVVARKLHSNGGRVSIYILGDPKKFTGAARTNFEIVQKLGLNCRVIETEDFTPENFPPTDVIVDAIFGTGLDRVVSGHFARVIQFINEMPSITVSVDIPSGIHGDTGQVLGVAVRADFTVTFGLPKTGNLLYPGFEHGGKLFVTHISFPPELHARPELKITVNQPEPLPRRNPDTHKGSFGKVLFIAGAKSYLGAPFFAAYSFLKAGGGLSFLAAPESMTPFIGGREIILLPQKETPAGSLAFENKDSLLKFSETVDFVVLGPGLSLHPETQQLVRELAAEIRRPLLIDGDGITAIASDLACLNSRQSPTILTPHLGEMARLVVRLSEANASDKIRLLQATARSLNAVIVLKGAHSLIGFPDESVRINFSGNPGMATAGSGDVLTGVIAAMFGIGMPLQEAVPVGVFLHGLAGDLAAEEKGQDGILAGDILNTLPFAIKKFRENYAEVSRSFYGQLCLV